MGRLAYLFVAVIALVAFAPAALAGPGEPDPCGCAPPPCPPCDPYPCCECRTPKDPTCPPKYHNLRFMENWRPCLCVDCCDKGDWSDKLKARPIMGRNVWANFGGQIRFRWESFGDIGFGAPADADDAWMLMRVRAHADIHFGDNFRVFIEGIYADQWEERELGARPIDINRGDILNLFAEAKGNLGCGEVGGWIGRRELQLGKQRLVSPLDWANTRRTFQGGGAWWKRGNHRAEAFYTRPVVIERDEIDDDWDDDRAFWGVNYTNTSLTCLTWEAYLLGLQDDATATRIEQDVFTIGGRIDGKIGGTRFDYDAEAAYQFGDYGTGDVSAWMFSGTFGWKPCTKCWDPRIAVGFDYASGDDDPNDTDRGTFNQLFPLGHKYLGHADLIGRQNIIAGRLEASIKPWEKVTITTWYHMFWRAEETDAVYNAAGGVLRGVPAVGNSDTAIGSELDIMFKYAIDRHWVAFVEWAHFFPSDFIDNTGANNDVDVWYLGVQGTF